MNFLLNPFQEDFKYPQLFLVGLGIVFFLPFLGSVHLFDWDEINFAESAREMMVTGDYFRVRVNFRPFWEKPPLFFWLQVVSMKIFGINEFAARFPNVICGIASLLIFYRIGKKIYDHRFGMIWSLLYFGALLPHLYFKSGIIDPAFNLFIFLGIYYLLQVIEGDEELQVTNSLKGGVFTGLAVLTKGPVGLLLVLLTFLAYWFTKRFAKVTSVKNILLFATMVFSVSCLWFGYETIKNGPWFLVEFVEYQLELFTKPVAGHQQPFYYHFVVVLLGCFPMSVLAIRKLRRNKAEEDVRLNFAKWMRILFWIVMVLFTIVTTKIVHYSSMAYFPLSFLAAFQLNEWVKESLKPRKWQLIFNLFVGVVLGLILAALPYAMHHKELLTGLIKDKFGRASLSIDVPMLGWEWIIGLIFIAASIMSFIFYLKGKLLKGLAISTFTLGLTMTFYSALILPKIEKYTQGPAIEFYEQMKDQDVYIHTFHFKSYADYFYARKRPERPEASEGIWLLTGPIDKPAYFVSRTNRMDRMKEYPYIKLMYIKGGFAFFKRDM